MRTHSLSFSSAIPGLEARLLWAMVEVYGKLGMYDQEAAAESAALACAYNTGYSGVDCPKLISAVGCLSDYFAQGRNQRLDDEVLRDSGQTEKIGDAALWGQFGLPAPERMWIDLLAGRSVEVDGHRVFLDAGMIWYTNPYGVDGCLGGEEFGYAGCRSFLTQILQGHIFGPVPH